MAAEGDVPMVRRGSEGHVAQLHRAVERVLLGQAALQEVMAEIAARKSVEGEQTNFDLYELDHTTNYQDRWPDVEVTVAMQSMSMFDLAERSIHVDLILHLDWTDAQLVPGIHYKYNAEHGAFEISKAVRESRNPFSFFNPDVFIENVKSSGDDILRSKDELPTIIDEVNRGGREVPWLTKKFHFMGAVSCREIDARYFPLDICRLSVRVTGLEMQGQTTSGKVRNLRVLEPSLRTNWRLTFKSAKKFNGEAQVRQAGAVMSHMWRAEEDGRIKGVGEMQVVAFGGAPDSTRSTYVFMILLSRQWFPRYAVNCAIMCLQVIGAGFSLWVPFTDDMLSNRMSITLTVLLTLVAGNAARPSVITEVPFPTLHDYYGQCMLFFVASVVAVANLVVFVSCWGMYRGTGKDSGYASYSWFDTDEQMVEDELADRWWCKESPFYTSKLDFIVVILAICFLVLMHCVFLTIAQLHRLTTILKVKHMLDVGDRDPTMYSKLVMYDSDSGLELLGREDIHGCMRHASLLPGVRLFSRVWAVMRRLRQGFNQYFGKHVPLSLERGFHPLDSARLLREARERIMSMKGRSSSLGNLSLSLSPTDTLRIMDVGSGEMGFYSYWFDSVTGLLRAEGINAKKLKYSTGKTFVDEFVTAECGAQSLTEEIIRRFNLTEKPADKRRGFGPNFGGFVGCVKVNSVIRRGTSAGNVRAHNGQLLHATAAASEPTLPGAVTEEFEGSNASGMILQDVGDTSPVSFLNRGVDSRGNLFEDPRQGLKPLFMCLTGANRQMLRDDEAGREQLQDIMRLVNDRLRRYGVEVISYAPSDADEAMCELVATEWVVQHGDLDVSNMTLDKAYQTLQGGRAEAAVSLQEVLSEFGDLRAAADLAAAHGRAAFAARAQDPTKGSSPKLLLGSTTRISRPTTPVMWSPTSPVSLSLELAATGNVGIVDRSMGSSAAVGVGIQQPPAVPASAFYHAFEGSAALMRALVRARLFAGTISAGSGSCQVTLRRAESLSTSQVHSIPLGNRTPLVSMKLTAGHDDTLFNKDRPQTRMLARELLCGPGPVKETRPAWNEDGVVDPKRLQMWNDLVEACCEELGLPTSQRGLFVGISAVFYAASEAKCDGRILERDAFLESLAQRRAELMEGDGGNGRVLANLTMVIALVRSTLHRSASIVCKRKWRIGEGDDADDFLATWTLGFYLRETRFLQRASTFSLTQASSAAIAAAQALGDGSGTMPVTD